VSVHANKPARSHEASSGQLPLELSLEPRLGAEDFLAAPSNQQALDLIERWPDWPAPLVLLEGPPGSGKSHLGMIWARRAGAIFRQVSQLDLKDHEKIASGRAILLDQACPGAIPERELFHVINSMREKGGHVLVTTAFPLARLEISTPDLLSRLRLAPVVRISSPDDTLVRAVLVKLFHDRQLIVDASVIEFVALRIERSLAAARSIVDALDREALSRGRAVTRPMAARLLARLAEQIGDMPEPEPGSS